MQDCADYLWFKSYISLLCVLCIVMVPSFSHCLPGSESYKDWKFVLRELKLIAFQVIALSFSLYVFPFCWISTDISCSLTFMCC